MRRAVLFLCFFPLSSVLLIPLSFAGGLETAKSTAQAAKNAAVDVVSAAMQAGTFASVEEAVNSIGKGIDWSFDQLVQIADLFYLPKISDDLVSGMGSGLSDLNVPQTIDQGLDRVEELGKMLSLETLNEAVQDTGLTIKPYFKSNMEYNSNVFYEPEVTKTFDEVLWLFTPGVAVNLPFGANKEHRIGAVYEARITEFTKYDQHDDIGQSVGGVIDLKPTDELSVSVKEEFVNDAARAGTRSAKRVEYQDNIVTPRIAYDWQDWTFEGEYVNAIRDFDSSIYRIFSYANNAFTTRALRNLSPGFRGLIEYTFSHYDYAADETRVGHYNQIKAGVSGNLSERTNILARVGYQERSYRAHDTDYDIPVTDVRLDHRLTDRASFDFYMHRTTKESQFTNNRALDEKLMQISGKYLFNQKFRGRSGLSIARRDFDNVATTGTVQILRRDLVGSGFVGFDYAFRSWLITNVDYRYERSNSNNSNFDYTNNVFSVGLTMPL